MSKISVVVEFTEADFKRMLKAADMKIADKAKFSEVFKSKALAKTLAEDLKEVWQQTNEDSGDIDSVLNCLGFEDCVEYNWQ